MKKVSTAVSKQKSFTTTNPKPSSRDCVRLGQVPHLSETTGRQTDGSTG